MTKLIFVLGFLAPDSIYAQCAIARIMLSQCRLFVCSSGCQSLVGQSKTAQARITKLSLSTLWKTLVSGSVKLFHTVERSHSVLRYWKRL